jgi:hypothetical protein
MPLEHIAADELLPEGLLLELLPTAGDAGHSQGKAGSPADFQVGSSSASGKILYHIFTPFRVSSTNPPPSSPFAFVPGSPKYTFVPLGIF